MLEILGGEIGELGQWDGSRVSLYGGRIETLQSILQAPWAGQKNIDLYCKDHLYVPATGMLTGTWGDDSAFSIHLVNVSGYSATIDNINFIIVPEPLTLALLAFGSLFVRRSACR